jgi:two-component system cell cycle sensor histidine kinase/response regulator CckA
MSAQPSTERERFAIPFAHNPFPMWVYDLKTLEFLDVNEAAIKSYGFSREEFLRMTVLDIRPNEDIMSFLHDWKNPHQSTGDKWWHIGKNGTRFPVSITSWQFTFHGKNAELVLARRESDTE